MVYEWNSQIARTNWCQRERWHHLPYVTHVATLRVRHCYWRNKIDHTHNFYSRAVKQDWNNYNTHRIFKTNRKHYNACLLL